MPFFDANRMCITVDYDDNMCLVGGSLRGVVNIFVRETVSLCGASLKYRIVEGCSLSVRNYATSPDCYGVEYVLFGARSTKQAPPVRVTPGHYSYPFAIPIPQYAPPTQRFGGIGDGLLRALLKGELSPTNGPVGPAVKVEHLVEVVVYVAHSWKDKHQSKNAPCVIRCTAPSLLLATNNGMEGHVRSGSSISLPGKSFFSKLFNSGPKKTKEQADCDLFVYNTTVSLADSPFLHFAVRGKTNCPYRVELVRVVKYLPPPAETPEAPNQTDGATRQNERASQRPPVFDEQVISSTTMPPLDSPTQGVRGRLLISPFGQEQSVSFASRCITVSYYVTLSLQYLINKSSSGIAVDQKMRIPITFFHGTFEEAITGTAMLPNQQAAETGTVMGYDSPPAGEHAQFRPAAPVTDDGVLSTKWANPNLDPVFMRPMRSNTSSAVPPRAPTQATANTSREPNSAIDPSRPSASAYTYSTPPAPVSNSERLSVHRRMYDEVAPVWDSAVRRQGEPVEELTAFDVSATTASPDENEEEPKETVTKTFI